MIQLSNDPLFNETVAEAISTVEQIFKTNAPAKIRTINAIAKAVSRLERDGDFINFDPANNELLIWSQRTNGVYTVRHQPNDAKKFFCECEAYKFNQLCWHVAALRLVELTSAKQAKSEVAA